LNWIGKGPWAVNGKKETPLLFEAQIRQDYLLYRGRSNQVPFLRSIMVNFDLGLNIRMYQGPDNPSYPIRPMNFMPGFSVQYLLNQAKFAASKTAMLDNSKIRNFYTLKIAFSHYSNGQSGAFYNADSTNSNRANGNFSTNFLRTELSWSRFFNDHLISANINYQEDFGIGDLLGFADEQNRSYGKSRAGVSLLFHSKNFQLGSYNYKRIVYRQVDSTVGRNKLFRVKSLKKYKRYFSIKARYDLEFILDDVSEYLTFKNISASKNRMSNRFVIAAYPANSRTLGIFISLYSGRDYYNVCYLDKIFNVKAGLVFDLNKYVPPGTEYMKTR